MLCLLPSLSKNGVSKKPEMLSVFRASRNEAALAGGRRWCESQAPVEQDDVPSAALVAASPSHAQSVAGCLY